MAVVYYVYMMTSTTNTPAEAVDLDKPFRLPCTRCGGYGDTCFKCGGHGKGNLTTQRKENAKAKRREKAAAKRQAKRAAELAIAAAKVSKALAADPELAAAFEVEHRIIEDIKNRFNGYGEISDKQRALVIKLAAEKIERDAAEAKRLEGVTDIEAGRYAVAGKVLSVKEGQNDWGYTYKMLVQLDNGNRVFGGIPSNLRKFDDEGDLISLRGERVTFTARFEPKEAGFGFFSRASKASIVTEVA